MKKMLYALKDCKSGFKDPFVDINNPCAIRHLSNALKDKNEFSMNPDDFELWYVGSLDTETGIIESKLEHIVNCSDLMSVSNGSN